MAKKNAGKSKPVKDAGKTSAKESSSDKQASCPCKSNVWLKVLAAAVIVVLIALAVYYMGQPPQKVPRVMLNKTSDLKELTKDDVIDLFDKGLLNSTFISVRGVRLGDSSEAVVAKLGRPASFESVEQGTLNLRYENPYNDTEFIVHLEDDKVTRIAIKPGFISSAVGRTKYNLTKDDVTLAFGKPDYAYDTKFYRIYEYHPEGLEIYLKARNMEGFGLVEPK